MCAKSKGSVGVNWQQKLATRVTVRRVCDNFESEIMQQSVHKKWSGKPYNETSPASFDVVLQHFLRSPENP